MINKQNHTNTNKFIKETALRVLKENHEDVEYENVEYVNTRKNLSSEPTPPFPTLIFMAAVFKDFLDIPGEFGIITIILTTFLSIILSVVFFVWAMGKISGGFWKKRLIRWLWIRYVAMFVIEIIPFFKIVPTFTIFILMVYYKEKKIVILFNKFLEELHSAGIGIR